MPTVNIPAGLLPAGMTEDAIAKLIASTVKSRLSTAARDKANRSALNDLKKQYPADYEKALAKYLPKEAASKK